MNPWREKEQENLALEYLSKIGMAVKFNMSGKPVKTKDEIKLAKFSNKYYGRGVLDIMFIKDGKVWFFDIKNPKTIKKYVLIYDNADRSRQGELSQYFAKIDLRRKLQGKDRHPDSCQWDFITDCVRQGVCAGWVEDVDTIKGVLESECDYYDEPIFGRY